MFQPGTLPSPLLRSGPIEGVPVGTEIERKFLVNSEAWRAAATRAVSMRQGYLASSPASSVRVRIEGDEARLNIKSATLGISRTEYEYPIPLEDALEILETLCGDATVTKTRHFVEHAGHVWEVDEFSGPNAGLVVAELELESASETFARPPWLGEEVSHDRRYYNVCLIDHPYCDW